VFVLLVTSDPSRYIHVCALWQFILKVQPAQTTKNVEEKMRKNNTGAYPEGAELLILHIMMQDLFWLESGPGYALYLHGRLTNRAVGM
jgi:hypothetical protein